MLPPRERKGGADALRLEGVNEKRIYWLYREERLMVRRLKRKRVMRDRSADVLLSAPDREWAPDSCVGRTGTGRALRGLTIVDSYARECPAMEVVSGICSRAVTRTLERINGDRGKPQALRCDGPEFTSRHFLGWCEEQASRSSISSQENR